MYIWVDADACPKVIKEILYRAAIRTNTGVVLVSNQALFVPSSMFIRTLQVPKGFDAADDEIVARIKKNDVVITADIPLADAVIQKDAFALNPRGTLYTKNNIKQIRSFRDLSMALRDSGIIRGGPPKISPREIQAFANTLDKLLRKQ
jgi:uncharacterized protein YaiI (UPF0178 family)